MGYLNAAEINAADDRKTVDFEVPEWGGTARLMVMSGKDLERFARASSNQDKESEGVQALLVGLCLVDENGKRLYTDADIRLLAVKSASVLMKVFKKCLEINKIENEETLEEAVEDFEEAPDEPSTTD